MKFYSIFLYLNKLRGTILKVGHNKWSDRPNHKPGPITAQLSLQNRSTLKLEGTSLNLQLNLSTSKVFTGLTSFTCKWFWDINNCNFLCSDSALRTYHNARGKKSSLVYFFIFFWISLVWCLSITVSNSRGKKLHMPHAYKCLGMHL